MDPITAKLMSAAGGAAADRIYVDDVFSTFLYDGTGADQSIVNGIDLSGEGGMVWIKGRDQARDWNAFDTERGVKKRLMQNSTIAESTEEVGSLSAFNSNGFTVGDRSDVGTTGEKLCSWTFRKCPGFFDVVTYTGDGTNNRAISHNLGHNIRALFIKSTSTSGDWAGAYLQGASLWTGESYTGMYLNKTEARGGTTADGLGVSAISTTTFTVNASGSSTTFEFVPNANGVTYVAYLFSDQAAFGANGDEQILEVGTYTGTGAAGNFIDEGWEPQWLMVKNTSTNGQNWEMFDNMRGVVTGGIAAELFPNTSSAERSAFNIFNFNATGFETESTLDETNASGDSYWYMAIRRPHKPPETAAECLDIFKTTSGSNSTQLRPGTAGSSVTDVCWFKRTNATNNWAAGSRLTGNDALLLNSNSAAGANTAIFGSSVNIWDQMSGLEVPFSFDTNSLGDPFLNVFFARKPGFFDCLVYKGTGSSGLSVNHNLGATPELLIYKNKNTGSTNWFVITASQSGNLNNDNAFSSQSFISFGSSSYTINTTGTSTNASGQEYLAYLFGSVSGISKIGTYSGTGNAVNVDCGFTNGARFVLIKRTTGTEEWGLFTTATGIVSGNDSFLQPNTNAAEDTSSDYIDPLSSGFTVAASTPRFNSNGETYFFLAIA